MTRADRASWILGLSVAAALAAPLAFVATPTLVAAFYAYDDNFYYLVIARHLAAGHGFTFDGLHRTNGFHPLWQLLLVPIGLLPGEGAPLRAVSLLETALVTAAAVLLFRTLRPRLGRWPALAAGLLLIAQPGATLALRAGMEGSLLLLVLVALWNRWLAIRRSPEPCPARWLVLGALCALAFLARLEALLTLPALMLLERRRLLARPRNAFALAAPAVACVLAYVAWNVTAFETWLPVSGHVKAHWFKERSWTAVARNVPSLIPVPGVLEIAYQGLFKRRLAHTPVTAVAQWTAVGLGLAMAWRFRRRLGAGMRRSGAAFPLLSAALIMLAHAWAVGPLETWQRVPLLLSASALAAVLLYRQRRLAPAVAALALLAVLARVPLAVWQASRVAGTPTGVAVLSAVEAGRWLGRNTTPEDRIGSWSSAGTLAYFSGRHVVNLDGLVNDADFYRTVVRGGRLVEYLRRERIGLLAEPACGPQPTVGHAVAQRLLVGPAHYPVATVRELLSRRSELLAAFAPPGTDCPEFAVWRIEP